MTTVSALALLAAWVALFFRHLASPGWAERIPVAAIAVPLAVSLVAALVARRTRTPALWIAIALTALSFMLFDLDLEGGAGARQAWSDDASHSVAEALRNVGNDVARLEDASSELSKRVVDHAARLNVPLANDPAAAFALLDSLAVTASRDRSLVPGAAVGFQLFDPDGKRIAWAGWPQALSPLDAMFVRSNAEFFYTRSVSLYQILSQVVPLKSAGGERSGSLLIDMPLEVDYRVNNRFLKSRSLADRYASAAVARVSFDYYPPTGNLPERLHRFQDQRDEAIARLERLKAARERAPARAEKDTTASRAPDDSLLTYFDFPANVQPEGEIAGDPETGLQGRVLIRSRVGNPLMSVTAVSHPFSHFAAGRSDRRVLWAKTLALFAWLALFVHALRRVPRG
ncbi:MAG TPA: hypothetical protein VFU38_08255, partial [Candidatus Krumholzibacteria bacterium]|nr:hypothetical protein [Candidatus Krumholzibacteria bacterium]